jgi:predicted RNA-binding Zn-ribbon protein involved in translation (DUF1610 family)
MNSKQNKIICPHCGQESFVKSKPVYEGFKKIGEELSCVNCGHVFKDEAEIPYKTKQSVINLTDTQNKKHLKILEDENNHKICRYCKYYVVNPFSQRCTYWNKQVEPSDSCENFTDKQTK